MNKIRISGFSAEVCEKASRLQKLNWVAYLSGSIPKKAAALFPKGDLPRFSASLIFAAFDVWRLRNKLVRKKTRGTSDCASPYHHLRPLFTNPWTCDCPWQSLTSSWQVKDTQPLSSVVEIKQPPTVRLCSTEAKGKTLQKRRKKRKTNEAPVQLRRSERLRNRKS